MTVGEWHVRAPNSVLLLGDSHAEPPEAMGGHIVSATGSCIAVGTRSEVDGETRVRVLQSPDALSSTETLAFDGMLDLPRRRLALMSVLGETYAEISVLRDASRVQVWVNDREEPTAIDLVIEGVEKDTVAAQSL